MPRRTTTLRPICKSNLCTFGFYVAFDAVGFYVMAGMGNTLHSHHPRLQQDEITFPTRLLSNSNKTILKDLGNSHAGSGVSVNYIAEKTGHIVTRQNVAYTNGLCNNLKSTDEMGINNSTEKMIKYLVTKNMIMLYCITIMSTRSCIMKQI